MDLLQPVVRPYAWGSHSAIAELQGRPTPTPGPEAELWMGAHPSAPSGVERNGQHTTLDAVIAADPAGALGQAADARFGGRLPFLLKILAAEKALSIQVHPSRAQAQAGFQAENERGLEPGDPARNYVDDWPKPELLCALTPFEVLAGFRGEADAAALLAALGVERLAPLAARLAARAGAEAGAGEQAEAGGAARAGEQAEAGGTARAGEEAGAGGAARAGGEAGAGGLTEALGEILGWPADDRDALIAEVVAACSRLANEDSGYAQAAAALVRVAADHPGDLGVVAALLLRHAVLRPGEALFMAAGGLHGYLHGTGVELLANSDNVVRAGLTGKHIDVPELLKLTDAGVTVPVLTPAKLPGGFTEFVTPAPEFRLYRGSLAAGEAVLPGDGPRLVLCVDGCALLRAADGDTVKLGRGESCFIPASDGQAVARGPAEIFLAGSGLPG